MSYQITVPVLVTDGPAGPSVSYGDATDNCPKPSVGELSVSYPKKGDIKIKIGPWSDKGKLKIYYKIDPESPFHFWSYKLEQTDACGSVDRDGTNNFEPRIHLTDRQVLELKTKKSSLGTWKLSYTLQKRAEDPVPFDPEITNTAEDLNKKDRPSRRKQPAVKKPSVRKKRPGRKTK